MNLADRSASTLIVLKHKGDEPDGNLGAVVINLAPDSLDINSLHQFSRPDEYINLAQQFEDAGEIEIAARVYRSLSLAFGPNAEVCFRLGELLYLVGQYEAARERYYMAVELDETYVEAPRKSGFVY